MKDYESAPSSKVNAIPAGEDGVRRLLRRAGHRPAVPAEDLARIKEAAHDEWRKLVRTERERREGFRVRGVLALAASLLLALLLGWWWTTERAPAVPDLIATVELVKGAIRAEGPANWEREGRLDLSVGDVLPIGAELEIAAPGDGPSARMALRLTGGQSVRLDVDTKVRLVSSLRLELERGAVYVESGAAPLDGAAVEVLTAFGIVRDVGTQYEVRLGEGGVAGVRVRVREGTVSLRRGSESYPATRGEELTLRRDGSVIRGSVEPYGPEWAWVLAAAPSLDIEGRSLRSFLDWVSRETGWRIRFADEALEQSAADVLLHGTIEDLTPDQSLSVVLPGSGLSYRVQDGTLWVARPFGERADS
ncbi:MAG: FecR family protein [Thermoanaerobaculia bacterium]